MAGTSASRIVYAKDERGLIVDSMVVGNDDETPDGFSDTAEYQTYIPSPTEAPPVAESRLTTWDGVVLGQTVDAIKDEADAQEGPSDPGGLSEAEESDGGGQVVTAVGPGEQADAGQTVDEIKNENDQQEGDTGEDSVDEESSEAKPKSTRAARK